MRGLTAEIQLRLQKLGKPWKWCQVCTHSHPKKWVEAVVFCPDCKTVYCAEHGHSCTCKIDD